MWICRKCSQPVFFAERKQSLGFDWHPTCLRCEECGKRLNPGQHAEHKGVPFCHHPCYGALFGPQLFGHGTRNECHTSFGRVENRDGQVKRSHLESHLKTYNNFYDGKPGELKSREVNGRLILEGVLRIYWGVKNIIHLKEEDDSRMIAARRKSCIEHRVNDTYGSDSDEEDPLWRDDSPNRIMNRQRSHPGDTINGELTNNSTINTNHCDNVAVSQNLATKDHEGNEINETSPESTLTEFLYTNGHCCETDNDREYSGLKTDSQTPGSETDNQNSTSETSINNPRSEIRTNNPRSEISTNNLRSETSTQYPSSEINTGTQDSGSDIKNLHDNSERNAQYPVLETDTKYPDNETGSEILNPVNNNAKRNTVERQGRLGGLLSKSGSTAIRRRPGRRMEKSRLKRRCSINGHFYLRETSSFTPPFGSPCSIWITSKTTAEEVLNMLLEKYKVEMSAFNFALFIVKDTGELRRVKEDESPLVTRVMLGPHEDVAKVFIMDAQRTHEVSHEVAQFLNLSLAECRAILVKYEQEEMRHLESIKRKYDEMRDFIQNKINKCTVEITFPNLS